MTTINVSLDLPYHFTIVRSVDDAGDSAWVASVDELPGCISQGDTIEEATTMIRDAMAGWIETGLRHGDHIPEPRDPESYRGQFMVRLPSGLHRSLDRRAEQEGVSLNQMVATVLAGGIGWSPNTESGLGERAMEVGKMYQVGRGPSRRWEALDRFGKVHTADSKPMLKLHLNNVNSTPDGPCDCSQTLVSEVSDLARPAAR